MSQDLSNAKKGTGSVYPEGTYDAGPGFDRVEPLLDASLLKLRFLGGINLRYPTTKEEITPEMMSDFIKRGMNQVELDIKTTITPVLRRVRLPFDRHLYSSNMWMEVAFKPISKVVRLAICSSSYKSTPQENDQYPSGSEIYRIPQEWIDLSYGVHGKVFVSPLNPAFGAISASQSAITSGGTILALIGQIGFVPAYWTAEVVTGLCSENGHVPLIVNEIVGAKAAMMLLDNLIPSYKIASQSLGIDGLSQSVNDLSYQLLAQKRKQLEEDYKDNCKKLKTMFGNNFFVSNV